MPTKAALSARSRKERIWFSCCGRWPSSPSPWPHLNVESSRTFGGSKKRATFNTDLSPLEKYFKWAVYAKFLGKKWSWVRLLWGLRGSASGRESRRKSWLKQKLTSLVKVELTNGWPYGFIVNHHYPLLTGCLIAQSKVDPLWVDDYRPSWLAITWPAVGWP